MSVTLRIPLLLLLGLALSQTAPGNPPIDTSPQPKLLKVRLTPPDPTVDAAKQQLSRFPAISVKNNILYFASWDHVEAARSYLEARVQDALYQIYLKYGEEDVPDEDYERFNIEAAYDEFEKMYGFTSLRQKVDRELEAWENSSDQPDPKTNPERNVVPDEELRVLLNTYSEISVGGKFYRLSPDGQSEYATESALIASRTSLDTSPATPVSRLLQTSQCQNPVNAHHIYPINSSYRIKIDLRHFWFITYRVVARTRLYKKRFGKWRRSYRRVYASASGYVSNLYFHSSPPTIHRNLCYGKFPYNLNNMSYKIGLFRARHRVKVNYRTRIGWTKGRYIAWPPSITYSIGVTI